MNFDKVVDSQGDLSKDEIMYCPFCGNDAYLYRNGPIGENIISDLQNYYVQCYCCGAATDDYASAEQAIKHWNMRA